MALMELELDDDGRTKRTGNALTASAHIITTVIGAGVLALPWALAQLGWIPGIAIMLSFSAISLFTYNLVADCYRFPDPLTGKRNYTYNQAVKAYLSGTLHVLCGLIVYGQLAGLTVGFTITSATSFVAMQKAVCFHRRGHEAFCEFSYNPFMIGFGILQVFLSQISNFHELTWLSTIAAITSFGYTFIASGLSLSVIVSGKGNGTSITGIEVGPELCAEEQVWRVFTAMGNIALASNYATVAFDIMDTLKSYPPENIQMKKANVIGITAMTILFLLCSCLGYTAFGDKTSGNIFGAFYEPFWLVSLGNVCILIHMVGAYQVVGQSFFRIVEMVANTVWPNSDFINKEHPIKISVVAININYFRLTWRTMFVIVVTILAMAMPFFDEILSLLGAVGFWPTVVFFPIQMHIAQKKITKLSLRWCLLQLLSSLCFLISLSAIVGSIHGISENMYKDDKVFMYKQYVGDKYARDVI